MKGCHRSSDSLIILKSFLLFLIIDHLQAPFLSYYLEKTPATVQGKRVIELGAGTGLVGMVANMLGMVPGGHRGGALRSHTPSGASDVTVTDMKTISAERNLHLNRHHLVNDRIQVSHLEWGQDISSFNPPYDVVLAADVIYAEHSFDSLLNTLEQLSDVKTTILISCMHRYDRVEKFFARVDMENKFRSTVVLNQGDLHIYQFVKS